jgi:hypothetical protein
MSRIVVDLSRDLPRRAAALDHEASAKVFGGCLGVNFYCVGLLGSPIQDTCCPGLLCNSAGFVKICYRP